MTRPEGSTSCARVRAMLEAYVDGALGARRVSRLETHLESCSSCKEELEYARNVRDSLRSLPGKTCPDVVMASVMKELGASATPEGWADGGTSPRGSISDRILDWSRRWWRPSVATAGVATVVLVVLLVARQEPTVRDVTPEEVARAETQVKWVMAQLGEISRRAGFVVRDEVIEARVVAPTARAVGRALVSERPDTAE